MPRTPQGRIWLTAVALSLAVASLGELSSAKDKPGVHAEAIEDETCKVVTDYANSVYSRIVTKWYEAMPLAASEGGIHGAVTLHFTIGRDGSLMEVTTVRKSKVPPFERAALKAVTRAAPFPPVAFVDPKCDRWGVTLNFFYNLSEEAREAWRKDGGQAASDK